MSYHDLWEEALEFKQSEMEIRHVFKHLVTTLCNQKWKIVEQMTEWSKTLIRQIQDHVSDQRKLLEQVYENKISYLDSIRDRFLQQAIVCERQKDLEQMHQLINQCTTLRSNVAMLIYTERPITSIQVLTEEQLSQLDSHDSAEQRSIDEECQTEATTQNVDSRTPSSPESRCVTTELVSQTSLDATSNDQEEPSLAGSQSLASSMSMQDVLMGKCPLCYMIFPNSMNAGDRNLHVNEHYRDD